MFQKSAQNKGYFGHGHLILTFARNCVLNFKSLPDENGTCAKSSAFEGSASLKGKGNISPIFLSEFISPGTSGNYNVHLFIGLIKSTGI